MYMYLCVCVCVSLRKTDITEQTALMWSLQPRLLCTLQDLVLGCFQVQKTLHKFECRPATSWRWGPHESCTKKTSIIPSSSHHHPNLIRLIMLRSITNCAFLKKKHENTSVSNRSTDEVLGIPGIIFFTMSLTLWPTKNPPGETSECPAKMLHWAQGPTRLGGGDDKPGWLGAAAGGNPTLVPLWCHFHPHFWTEDI